MFTNVVRTVVRTGAALLALAAFGVAAPRANAQTTFSPYTITRYSANGSVSWATAGTSGYSSGVTVNGSAAHSGTIDFSNSGDDGATIGFGATATGGSQSGYSTASGTLGVTVVWHITGPTNTTSYHVTVKLREVLDGAPYSGGEGYAYGDGSWGICSTLMPLGGHGYGATNGVNRGQGSDWTSWGPSYLYEDVVMGADGHGTLSVPFAAIASAEAHGGDAFADVIMYVYSIYHVVPVDVY
jgi:hypothetical protein